MGNQVKIKPRMEEKDLMQAGSALFDYARGSNDEDISNYFYFVYNIADKHQHKYIQASLIFYRAGYTCIAAIALQNIYYVWA